MRAILTCLFLFFPFLIPLTFSQSVFPDYVDGKLYVRLISRTEVDLSSLDRLKAEGNAPEIAALVAPYGIMEAFRPFRRMKEEVFTRTYELHFDAQTAAGELMDKLNAIDYVEFAERVPLNHTFFTPNDPNQSSQWYLSTISAFQAWDIHQGGSAVIAIADDAVRITHQDIAPNVWVNPGEIAGDGIDNDNNGYIDDINGFDTADDDNNPNPPASATNSSFTHGTHVAGISSAATHNSSGVASIGFDCKIMAIKSTQDNASNTNVIQTGYQSVEYAIAAGADVINMSWGGSGSSNTIQTLLNSAFNQGIVLVAAAGNDNTSQQLYPAAYNNVISVASTTNSDSKSSFSNFGTWIDISAPGSSIFSTLAGSNSSYGNLSGTSMASPMVAGLCGLMRSYTPTATPTDILNCLISGADNIDAQNGSFIGQLGAGRINAQAALQCLNPNVPPIANFNFSPGSGCVGTTVSFTDQSTSTASSWSWSFPGGTPATSTQQNPTVTYNTPGTYDVSLTATNGFGSDTETQTGAVTIFSGGLSLPFTEDFESGFGAQGWSISNPDNGLTWSLATVGGTTPGSTAASMEFYNYSSTGQRDQLDSPPFDWTGYSAVTMTFEHAYRRFNTNSSDSLLIYVSTDCGQTFPNKIFAGAEDGTGSFATAVTSNQAFAPSQASEWCMGTVGANCFSLDLSAFVGNSSVVIRFEGYSNYQNNLYLDNINITGQSANVAPTVAFTANTTFGCAPMVVNFSDQSTASPTAWAWSFPGGTPATSTAQNPVVTYSTPGTYDVSLTATNANGSNSLTQTGFITANTCAPSACDTLNNWGIGSTSALYTVSGNGGYVAGHNTFGDIAKVEYFANPGNAGSLTATLMNFGKAVGDSATSFVTARVWDNDGTAGAPGTVLASQQVLISDVAADLAAGNATFVDFGGPVAVSGGFYVGIELNYSPGGGFADTVALITNLDPQSIPATAWEQWGDGTWHAYDEAAAWGLEISHAIFAFVSDVSPVAAFTADTIQGCQGFTVNYSNTSTDGTSFLWSFPGGTPSTSTDPNPIVTYDTAGVYDVSLIAFGECLTVDITTNAGMITVLEAPTVVIGGTFDDACGQGLGAATVVASGTVGGFTYVWDTNPVQTSNVALNLSFGTYTATVTNPLGCSASATAQVGDTPGPNAIIDSWTNETCGLANGTATATATSGSGNYAYLWNTVPAQTTATATGLVAGTYQVIISDANSCVDSASVLLTGSTAVAVTATSTDENCGGANGSATAQISGGSAPFGYAWNTSPAQTTATASGLAAGTFTVTVTDGNSCTGTATATVSGSGQAPQVDLGPDLSVCEEVMLDAGTSTGSLLWSTGATSQQITVTQSGAYWVELDVGSGCVGRDTIQVIILATPTIDLGADTTACDAFVLDAGNPGSTYTWSTGATSQTISVSQPGLYIVSLIDANGCTASGNITIGFTTPPTPDLGADTTGCAGIVLDAGPGATYAWSNGASSPTLSLSNSGTYSVVVTNAAGCEGTDAVDVTILPDPVAGYNSTANGLVLSLTNTSQNATAYAWDFGDGTVATSSDPVHTYALNGTYTVRLVVLNDCGTDTVTQQITVDAALSIGGLLFRDVQIFPNPSTGIFQVAVTDPDEQLLYLRVTNVSGQDIWSAEARLTGGTLSTAVDLSHFASGLYFLHLKGAEKQFVQKLEVIR